MNRYLNHCKINISMCKNKQTLILSLSTLLVAKSPEALRDMLKTTMKYQNKPRLETLVSEVEDARYPELFSQLHEARAFLDTLEDEAQG